MNLISRNFNITNNSNDNLGAENLNNHVSQEKMLIKENLTGRNSPFSNLNYFNIKNNQVYSTYSQKINLNSNTFINQENLKNPENIKNNVKKIILNLNLLKSSENIKNSRDENNQMEKFKNTLNSIDNIISTNNDNDILDRKDFDTKFSNILYLNNQIITKTTKDEDSTIKNNNFEINLKQSNIDGPEDLHFFYVNIFQKKRNFEPKFDF